MERVLEPAAPDSRRAAALHAYEHARDAGKPIRHRVDVVDEPLLDDGAPRKRPMVFPMRWAPTDGRRVEHAIADPTSTAFKVGFGFAAGAWVFRLAVLVGLGLVLFVLVTAVASSLLD